MYAAKQFVFVGYIVHEFEKHDKKMDAGKIKFVLLSRIGEAYVTKDVTDDEILDAVRYILEDGKDE